MRAVQFLFQCDFNDLEVDEALALYWDNHPDENNVRGLAEQWIYGVLAHRDAIDRRLQSVTENWDLNRIGAVDRNVMRLAIYEMEHCLDIPPVVSINEAVDLAKELSSRDSGRFVNGVLDRIRKDLPRPARVAGASVRPQREDSSDGDVDRGTA